MFVVNLESEEIKFNNFLNKTIIFSSKSYYKKEVIKNSKELKIIDDDNYSEYLKKCLKYENENYNFNNIEEFIEKCDNETLSYALKKLSNIEITVIFGSFVEQLNNQDLSKTLNICSSSVSRIKMRALKKIKKILEGSEI